MVSTTRELFAGHSIRCTSQRRALYEALLGTKSHPTAEELYRQVQCSAAETMSLATVYSALETFCRVGLARKVSTVGGSCRYDATTAEHVHVRNGSGDIEDVPPELGSRLLSSLSPSVIGEIERELGVRVDGVDIQLLTQTVNRPRNGAPPRGAGTA